VWITRHDNIAPGIGANHDRRIDHIRSSRVRTSCSRRTSASFIEHLDPTAAEQTQHLRLMPSPPTLTQHASGNRRNDPALQRPPMPRPRPPPPPQPTRPMQPRASAQPWIRGNTRFLPLAAWRYSASRTRWAASTPVRVRTHLLCVCRGLQAGSASVRCTGHGRVRPRALDWFSRDSGGSSLPATPATARSSPSDTRSTSCNNRGGPNSFWWSRVCSCLGPVASRQDLRQR